MFRSGAVFEPGALYIIKMENSMGAPVFQDIWCSRVELHPNVQNECVHLGGVVVAPGAHLMFIEPASLVYSDINHSSRNEVGVFFLARNGAAVSGAGMASERSHGENYFIALDPTSFKHIYKIT